jgi:hypothetical protein
MPSLPWWVLPLLGAMTLGIFAGALTASCFVGDTTLRTTMFTAAVTITSQAVGYYFGSSAGSSKKDETIAAQAATAPGATPVVTLPGQQTVVETTAPSGATTTTTTGSEPAEPKL